MGLRPSKESDVSQVARNKEIDRLLAQEREKSFIKLLLLGSGECGKSTILKQMRIIHDKSVHHDEDMYRKSMIYSNVIQSMCALVEAMKTLNIQFDRRCNKQHAHCVLKILEAEKEQEPFSPDLFDSLKRLWDDNGIQVCYARRSDFQLNDSAKYFLDDLDRIHAPDFVPTKQDYLQTRVATMGISEVEFVLNMATFRVFDVGGQKSQRRKWMHYFDDVNAIIFIVALSEFDKSLREDDSVNRMTDALALFGETANNKIFTDTSIVLFLNKMDLFREKIQTKSIKSLYPDFTGGHDYEQSVAYIQSKFEEVSNNKDKSLHFHRTCAINTDQMQLVLQSVTEFIIQKNQRGSGFS